MPNDLPPSQTVTINSTNQSGGTNIGILNINSAQPLPRKISDEQSSALKKLALGTPQLTVSFTIDPTIPDGAEYAQQLATALAKAGFKINPNANSMSSMPPQQNITVLGNTDDVSKKFSQILHQADIKVSPTRSGVMIGTVSTRAPSEGDNVMITIGFPEK